MAGPALKVRSYSRLETSPDPLNGIEQSIVPRLSKDPVDLRHYTTQHGTARRLEPLHTVNLLSAAV